MHLTLGIEIEMKFQKHRSIISYVFHQYINISVNEKSGKTISNISTIHFEILKSNK